MLKIDSGIFYCPYLPISVASEMKKPLDYLYCTLGLSVESVEMSMQRDYPGKYTLIEVYSPQAQRFKLEFNFETDQDKTWFILKYGDIT